MKYRVSGMMGILWLSAFLFMGCATISPYNQYAYVQVVNLKVDSLQLMDKARTDYTLHEKEIGELKTQIEKAYEYEKGRPKNSETTKMWERLKDPERDLLGGFLKLWQHQNVLSEFFIAEKKKQIAESFDQISELESGKIRKTE